MIDFLPNSKKKDNMRTSYSRPGFIKKRSTIPDDQARLLDLKRLVEEKAKIIPDSLIQLPAPFFMGPMKYAMQVSSSDSNGPLDIIFVVRDITAANKALHEVSLRDLGEYVYACAMKELEESLEADIPGKFCEPFNDSGFYVMGLNSLKNQLRYHARQKNLVSPGRHLRLSDVPPIQRQLKPEAVIFEYIKNCGSRAWEIIMDITNDISSRQGSYLGFTPELASSTKQLADAVNLLVAPRRGLNLQDSADFTKRYNAFSFVVGLALHAAWCLPGYCQILHDIRESIDGNPNEEQILSDLIKDFIRKLFTEFSLVEQLPSISNQMKFCSYEVRSSDPTKDKELWSEDPANFLIQPDGRYNILSPRNHRILGMPRATINKIPNGSSGAKNAIDKISEKMNELLGVPKNSECYKAKEDRGLQNTLIKDQVFARFFLGTVLEPDSHITDRSQHKSSGKTPLIQTLLAVANAICRMKTPLHAENAFDNLPLEAWYYIGEVMASSGSNEWLCYYAHEEDENKGQMVTGDVMAQAARELLASQDDEGSQSLAEKDDKYFMDQYNWAKADKYLRKHGDIQTILHPGAMYAFSQADGSRSAWLQQLFGAQNHTLGDIVVSPVETNPEGPLSFYDINELINKYSQSSPNEDIIEDEDLQSDKWVESRDPFADE